MILKRYRIILHQMRRPVKNLNCCFGSASYRAGRNIGITVVPRSVPRWILGEEGNFFDNGNDVLVILLGAV